MLELELLHEDDDLVVVAKPAGIAVVPGRGEPPESSLRFALEVQLGGKKLWVVHRLDRDVSGALVLARTAAAHRALSLAFEHGAVRKTYWALVDGAPDADAGRIDAPLRTGGHGGRTVIDPRRGKPSLTEWRLRERLGAFSVLEVEPRTGRTHQVRVHLRALGHPLACDRRYGRRSELRARDLAPTGLPAPESDEVIVARASLHAERVELPLPAGGTLAIAAPLPPDLARAIALIPR